MKADKRGGEFGFLNDGCAEGTLISKAAEGDDKAFELLMKAHLKVIYNYICIHVESKEDVQDLVQETMLGVWSGLKYFRNDSSFRTWVMGITRRKVYDFYRSRYKTSELTMPEDEGSLVSEDEPDRLLETLDVNSAVNRLNSMEQSSFSGFQCAAYIPGNIRGYRYTFGYGEKQNVGRQIEAEKIS